jgi:hypothetical protein
MTRRVISARPYPEEETDIEAANEGGSEPRRKVRRQAQSQELQASPVTPSPASHDRPVTPLASQPTPVTPPSASQDTDVTPSPASHHTTVTPPPALQESPTTPPRGLVYGDAPPQTPQSATPEVTPRLAAAVGLSMITPEPTPRGPRTGDREPRGAKSGGGARLDFASDAAISEILSPRG